MTHLVRNKKMVPIVTKRPIIIGLDNVGHNQLTYWVKMFSEAMDRSITIATNGYIHPLYLKEFEIINKHDVYSLHEAIYISFLGQDLGSFFESFVKYKLLYVMTLPHIYTAMKCDKYRLLGELNSNKDRCLTIVPTSEGLYEKIPYDEVIFPFDMDSWLSFIHKIDKLTKDSTLKC